MKTKKEARHDMKLRISEASFSMVRAMAKESHRTLNGMICAIIDEAIAEKRSRKTA